MTQYEAETALNELCKLYVYNQGIEARERRIWIRFLKTLDVDLADKTIDKLYENKPPGGKFASKKLPAIITFKNTYHSLMPSSKSGEVKRWCPCCNGSSFILIPDTKKNNYAHKCPECSAGKPTDDLCGNLHCQNSQQETALEFPAGYFDKYPWREVGYKRCCFKPTLTEKKKIKYDGWKLIKKVVDRVPF